MEKHLFLSDTQVPDQNEKAIEAVFRFIKDYRPDYIHLVGDIVSFDKVSKYTPDPRHHMSLEGEIEMTKKLLDRLTYHARKANGKVKIHWYGGNHEDRLIKHLYTHASALANLIDEDDDDYIISVPHIFELKKRGIKWIDYSEDFFIHKLEIQHGRKVRSLGGYTAQANINKEWCSGVSGHTHRLALVFQTHRGKVVFWIENGSLCKLKFRGPYTQNPDWQTGFSIASYEKGKWYPQIVPIIDNEFFVNGKLYK